MPQRCFEVGDLIPGIVILRSDGERIDLGARHLAGQIHVLALSAPADLAAMHGKLAEVRGDLDTFQAMAAMISAPDANLPPGDWPTQLVDPSGEIAKGFSLAGSGFVVLDPVRRLTAVIPWSEHATVDLLAACRAIYMRTQDTVVAMQPPVLIIPRVFEPPFCEALIDYWATHDKQANMVSSGRVSGGIRTADTTLKRRLDVAIVDLDVTKQIADRLSRRVGPMIWTAFRTMANGFETFRVGCYTAEERGYFGRHWDNTTPGTAHRKLAMTVNLNAGDYEGGELVFPEFGRQRYRPSSGDAAIFSCALLHEALPVTAGRRYGLFGFFHDEAGAKKLKERIAKDQAAAQAQ